MNLTPLDFEDYKPFLQAWIAAQPHKGHGSKAAMARAAQCQTAYISQVVLGSAHLSLEQAEKIAGFFGLSEEELHYFLLLVQKDRAGTETLRRYFLKQMQALKKKRMQLKNRVEAKTELTPEAQATYFSSWTYPAIHLLTKVPGFERAEAMAKRLDLPLGVVEDALRFLESVQLLTKSGGKYIAGTARMHLPHDSPLISKHHVNWRLRAIRDLEIRRDESLHYSSVVTLSRKDAGAIREILMKTIESSKGIIKESKDEALYSLCLDYFEV